MTLKGLLSFFENYYGEKYTGVFLDATTAYLDGHSENYYKAIAEVMIKRFSRIYNKAPGPAEIEKNMEEIDHVFAAIPKPLLPEPTEACATSEEAAEYIKAIKDMFSKGTGPLAGAMAKAIGGEGCQ